LHARPYHSQRSCQRSGVETRANSSAVLLPHPPRWLHRPLWHAFGRQWRPRLPLPELTPFNLTLPECSQYSSFKFRALRHPNASSSGNEIRQIKRAWCSVAIGTFNAGLLLLLPDFALMSQSEFAGEQMHRKTAPALVQHLLVAARILPSLIFA